MTLSHEEKFRRAVYHASLVYGKYMSKEEVRRYVTDLRDTVKGDWFLAVIALKSVIAEYDVLPTVSDIFTAVLNINDDPSDPAWDLSAVDEDEFYRIDRPVRIPNGGKTWPGGDHA